MLKVMVVGELCAMCHEGWESPYASTRKKTVSDASEMTLEELIATQASGKVPGDDYRDKHEYPFWIE